MSQISRRHFLVAAAVAVPATALGSTRALAVDRQKMFTDAAARYGVPAALLAAVSHSQSRWDDHDGRPSTSLGYGPMHLVDGAAAHRLRAQLVGKQAGTDAPASVDTLGRAARLSGRSAEKLRTNPADNIAGAAALLADAQRRLGHAVGEQQDPADWYAAVALTSGVTAAEAQREFADDVMATLRKGAARSASGHRLELDPQQVGSVDKQRRSVDARADKAARRRRDRGPVDAPKGLRVDWVPAPYEQTGPEPGDYGNHDLADRPRSPKLTTIVIHDTEATYATCMKLVTDPDYLAWNYTVRSSDGLIAQHLETKDVGWHAGNWYINMHSLGVEHEGFAAAGATWYSEPLYRRSARLVSYLARKYDIPLDRGHIIGHDQVPGVATVNIRDMHWDPGPFWDWEHYFDLLGAPLRRGTWPAKRRPRTGDALRILPGFADNKQRVTGCDGGTPAICLDNSDKPSNFVPLYTQPDPGTPLAGDVGLHTDGSASTTVVSDTGARAAAGTDYVCAGVLGDWTAIWYLGQRVWFRNPRRDPTARVLKEARIATVENEAATYGVCYPDPSEPGASQVPTVTALPYRLRAGEAYVVADAKPPTDYYRAKTYDISTPGDHVDIKGSTRYVSVYVGHRIGYLKAEQVRLRRR